jgi:hypothetical protein
MRRMSVAEEADVQAQLRAEMPEIHKAIEAMGGQAVQLPDVGRMYAITVLAASIVYMSVNTEEEALGVSAHMHEQIDMILRIPEQYGLKPHR